MIRSMTGYGRKTASVDGYEITFEIKSVNNRFLDLNIRLPRVYGYLEEKIKAVIRTAASRGKADAYLSIERSGGEDALVEPDLELARQYAEAMRKIARDNGLRDDISVSSLSRFSDIFNKKTKEEDEDEVWQRVMPVVKDALDAFLSMRKTEGENLYRDLSERLDKLAKIREQIAALSDEALKAYRERLEAKLRDLLEDRQIDEGRLLTEVGIIADKIDTGEELTRLESHIAQFRKLLLQDSPSGRTLDFLTQELNREVNTIGSKCSLLEITNLVIDAKNEIERIREQIQNIE